MYLLAGVGNPGPRYETTRHNAGFLLIDELASRFDIKLSESKFDGLLGKGLVLGHQSILVKPQTFVNLSGRCVGALMRFHKIPPYCLIAIYDDVDMEPLKVKARFGGSSGGHNGVKSLIQEIGSADFHKIKIGVGKPPTLDREAGITSWVLGKLSDQELLAYQNQVLSDVLLRLQGIFDAQTKND